MMTYQECLGMPPSNPPPSVWKKYVILFERISLIHNVVLELSSCAFGITSSFLFGIASRDFFALLVGHLAISLNGLLLYLTRSDDSLC